MSQIETPGAGRRALLTAVAVIFVFCSLGSIPTGTGYPATPQRRDEEEALEEPREAVEAVPEAAVRR